LYLTTSKGPAYFGKDGRINPHDRIGLADHVESDGCSLFEQVRKMDLEGIVCKRKDSPYKVTEKPSRAWIKVKNSRYSQLAGRDEWFERP
jgi:ATP-dependent DNA ligase